MLGNIGAQELLPVLLSLVAALVVIQFGKTKQGGIIPLVAGAGMALFSYNRYSQYSGLLGQFAAAFDNSIAYLQYFWLGSLMLWLAVGAWGIIHLVSSGRGVSDGLRAGVQAISAPPTADDEVLTNQAVTAMIGAHLGDEVITNKIRYSRCAFALSSADLATLKQQGASDAVISAMLESQAKRGAAR